MWQELSSSSCKSSQSSYYSSFQFFTLLIKKKQQKKKHTHKETKPVTLSSPHPPLLEAPTAYHWFVSRRGNPSLLLLLWLKEVKNRKTLKYKCRYFVFRHLFFFFNFPSDQKHLFDLDCRHIGSFWCPLTPTMSETAQADDFYLIASSDNNWGTDPAADTQADPCQGPIK